MGKTVHILLLWAVVLTGADAFAQKNTLGAIRQSMRVANDLYVYDPYTAVVYLEQQISAGDWHNCNEPRCVEPLLTLAKCYEMTDNPIAAAQALMSADTLFTDSTDKEHFLDTHSEVAEHLAHLFLRGKDYSGYVQYALEGYALMIARELLTFPDLRSFYLTRLSHEMGEDNPLVFNDDLNQSFAALGIAPQRDSLLAEFFNYCYITMPANMGLPPESVDNETYANWNMMVQGDDEIAFRLKREFDANPFGQLQAIHLYIQQLLKKYKQQAG